MADLKISALTGATTPLAGTEVLPIVQSSTTKKVSVANLTAGRSVSVKDLAVTDGNVDLSKNGTSFQWSAPGNFVAINATSGTLDLYAGTSAYTKYVSLSATGDYTLVNGNLIQGTAAKGINFTANTPAAGMASQLLNWYEEGTFTPTIVGSTSAGTASYTGQQGAYTRIGRVVHFQIYLVWSGGTGTGDLRIGGLPFTSGSGNNGFGCAVAMLNLDIALSANSYTVGGYVLANDTSIRLMQNTVAGGAIASIAYDAAGEIMLTGSYFV